jgi:N-acetylglucosamine kinase-like BadF-type ATPase
MSEDKTIWTGAGAEANLASTPNAIDNLRKTVEGCPQPEAVCAAFAGLVSSEQKQSAESALSNLFPNARVVAVPDYEAALIACGNGIDVCVIAGTGSLVCSRTNGVTIVSGGRGYILGDEGSAFQYGRDALLHYLDDAPDDISQDLRKAIETTFGTTKKPDVINALYAATDAPKRIASLAEAFAKDAERQSIYALKSLRIHPGKLAHIVAIHLRTYMPELMNVNVGCQGGLWTGKAFRDAFTQQLAFWCKADTIDVDFDVKPPVYGAVQIAKGLLGGN